MKKAISLTLAALALAGCSTTRTYTSCKRIAEASSEDGKLTVKADICTTVIERDPPSDGSDRPADPSDRNDSPRYPRGK